MKKERKNHQFVKKPYYEGGMTAMKAFLKKNLSYPIAAKRSKIEGTVSIRYTINYKGKVVKTKIIAGIGYGCDEEATRLVKLLVFKVPKNRKLKAVFHKDLQIHFRLPKLKKKEIKPSSANPTIQYNYILTPKIVEQEDVKEKKEGKYDITIRF